MDYKATAKYIHMSPRKLRLMADSIRGMSVEEALAGLDAASQRSAKPLAVLIRSAVANAKVKNGKVGLLTVLKLEVDGGPAMKRWHAVSKGSAHAYKKRMSHVNVTLSEEKIVPPVIEKKEVTKEK